MIKVNVDNIYANIERLFINWDHAILELIQNVERSGGNKLDLTIKYGDYNKREKKIIAIHNGRQMSVKDMESVFGVGETNWNNNVDAYGVGLMELIGQSKKVEIYSGNLYASVKIDKLVDAKYREKWTPEKKDKYYEKTKIIFYLKENIGMPYHIENLFHSFNVVTNLIMDFETSKDERTIKPLKLEKYAIYKKELENGDKLYILPNDVPYMLYSTTIITKGYVISENRIIYNDNYVAYDEVYDIKVVYEGNNIELGYPYRNVVIRDDYSSKLFKKIIPEFIIEYYNTIYKFKDDITKINCSDAEALVKTSIINKLDRALLCIPYVNDYVENQYFLIRKSLLNQLVEKNMIAICNFDYYLMDKTTLDDFGKKLIIINDIAGMDKHNIHQIEQVEYNDKRIQFYEDMSLICDKAYARLSNGERVEIDSNVFIKNISLTSNNEKDNNKEYYVMIWQKKIYINGNFFINIASDDEEASYMIKAYGLMYNKIMAMTQHKIYRYMVDDSFETISKIVDEEIDEIRMKRNKRTKKLDKLIIKIKDKEIQYKLI